MKTISYQTTINLSAYKIELGKDDIIRATVKDNVIVNLKSALEMTEAILKISPDASRPLLVNLSKINYITKEARDHFKGENRKPTAPAVALIANSRLSILIGNFYLGLNKPHVPTKLFKNEKNAVDWLSHYL